MEKALSTTIILVTVIIAAVAAVCVFTVVLPSGQQPPLHTCRGLHLQKAAGFTLPAN